MRSDRLRLMDMLDAIDVVRQYLPATREAFDRDPPVQSHVYRHVMIVGEAAWRLSKRLKDAHPRPSTCRRCGHTSRRSSGPCRPTTTPAPLRATRFCLKTRSTGFQPVSARLRHGLEARATSVRGDFSDRT
ncbi:MAG TPA: HepT-like ribonuclease domain-containing protein [Tepidisphaeraceae bacterium]|nr:HepT-like ribonuclease domain-containing protein [Tepidisphaeraceae bacterium]